MLILAAFLTGTAAFFSSVYFPATTGLIVCALACGILYSIRTPFASRLRTIIFFLLACGAGFTVAAAQHNTSIVENLEGKTLTAYATPLTDAVTIDVSRGLMAQSFRITSAVDPSGSLHAIRQIRVLSDRSFALDKSYVLTLRLPRQIAVHNPGMQGSSITGYLVSAEERSASFLAPFGRARAALHRFFLDRFSNDPAAFLISIVTGERGYLPRELNQAFGVTGLAHILSISGTHFGLVFYALYQLCRLLILRMPERMLTRLTLALSPSQAGAALALPAVVLYLCISDMSYPAVRSFLMILLFLLGLLLGRSGVWLNTLLFAAVLIVAVDPEAMTDLSFQLSFLASLCIGLVSDWLRSHHENAFPAETGATSPLSPRQRIFAWSKRTLGSSLCISLAASLGTAPLVALQFHYASLISPLTNLVLTPLIGLIILPFALAGSLCYLLTGLFPFPDVLEQITAAVLSVVQTCAAIPHAELRLSVWPPVVPFVFYGLLLGMVWFHILIPMLRKDSNPVLSGIHASLLASILVVACLWSSLQQRDGMFITFLDVGQGDSAVLEAPDRRTIVIDTGRNYQPLNAYLRHRGERTIDALALTHAHPDHTSGFVSLMRDYRILELWDNGRLRYTSPLPAMLIHRRLERGDLLEARDYRFTILHPYREYRAEKQTTEENNDSLVIKLEAYGNSLLFTGDIGADAEESLLPLGNRLASTILKVPHHGSRSSLSEPFLRRIHPRYAIISVGRNNSYGHPHQATVQALQETDIYRTDRDGAVGVHLKSDGSITVKTWRQTRLQPAHTLQDERKNAERLLTVW